VPAAVAARILQFNQGRRPDTLALKFARLRKNAFSFLRGTGHLFYQGWSPPAVLAPPVAPVSLISGDLHLENFGAYLGENGLTYFGVNDFDDAALAPVTCDLTRYMASLFIGLSTLGRPATEAKALSHDFLEAYIKALAAGGARLPDAALQAGPIGELMRALPARQAPLAADDRIEQTAAGWRIKAGKESLLPIGDAERGQITQLVQDFGRQRAAGSWRVLDVTRWVAGTSSLGLDRYAVLVDGEGVLKFGPLLEVKEVRGSCLAPYLNGPQPSWPSEAERVLAAQRSFQTVPPALLWASSDGSKGFILRVLARSHERLNLSAMDVPAGRLETVMRTKAQVVANGHLRGSVMAGASGAGALQAFAREAAWHADLIKYAQDSAAKCQGDYQEYITAYDRGELSAT
jgi:uncharacterized protein (DUF2252 family)